MIAPAQCSLTALDHRDIAAGQARQPGQLNLSQAAAQACPPQRVISNGRRAAHAPSPVTADAKKLAS
jgi:hypothetical protein